MKRGEVWTAAGAGDYGEKPRPVVIVQDDRFDATASVTACAFTSDPAEAPPLVEPSEQNGLNVVSRLMVDKITTVPKSKLGIRIGRLARWGHVAAQPRDADFSRSRWMTGHNDADAARAAACGGRSSASSSATMR